MSDLAVLDDVGRFDEIRRKIQNKPFLRQFYEEIYEAYRACLELCPSEGVALELGSGAGFVKEVLPEIQTSDVLAYPGVDHVFDAREIPFENESVRMIAMTDVFHHIPDVERFLSEAERVLKPGGRIFIHDQYLGWISTPILKYVHHEPFDAHASRWQFETTGPLSGANGALAWMVFERDRAEFEAKYRRLKIDSLRPHSPLRYWLSGGLKDWCLVPGFGFGAATWLDRALVGVSSRLASFVDIQILKL